MISIVQEVLKAKTLKDLNNWNQNLKKWQKLIMKIIKIIIFIIVWTGMVIKF